MTTYKPGTVAMVTYKGERCRAMLGAEGSWAITWKAMRSTADGPEVSDITPLVCIEATRADADVLRRLVNVGTREQYVGGAPLSLLNRIIDAIREQAPEPEPVKRWTVQDMGRRSAYLFDRGVQVAALFDSGASHAQVIADALNAAEETP